MTRPRDPDDVTVPVHGLPSPTTRWNVQCLNCHAELHGRFCAACGQRAVPPHPTVHELAGDAIGEFTGWDGKFAETLHTLLRRPGELTRQWLEGRRAQFISPLRLYLTASLLFFVVQSSVPNLEKGARAQFSVVKSNPERASEGAARAMIGDETLTAAERDSAMAAAAKAPGLLAPMLQRMIADPKGFKASLRRLTPRMFFALLPFYAAVLALFYRRRNYPEHLYFAIHLHAFVFIALLVAELAKVSNSVSVASIVGGVTLLWIAAYSLIALKRVYGGGWARTILKAIGIMLLYGVIAIPMMLATISVAALL